MAEWSKALDLGSSLSGGVGSNPTAINFFRVPVCFIFKFIDAKTVIQEDFRDFEMDQMENSIIAESL